MMIMSSHYHKRRSSSEPARVWAWVRRAATVSLLIGSGLALAQSTVIVSIEPYREMVTRLLPSDTDVTVLVAPGASPHGFDPSPRDVAAIADADLVVLSGGSIDDWIAELVEAAGTQSHTFMAIEAFDPSELVQGAHDHDHEHEHEHENDHDHEHEHEHEHENDHEHEHEHGSDEKHEHGSEEDHEHGSEGDHDDHAGSDAHEHDDAKHDEHQHADNHDTAHSHDDAHATADAHDHDLDVRIARYADVNAHIWLSPAYMARITEAFAAMLIEEDPDRTSEIVAARDAYLAELRQLDEEIAGLLSVHAGAPFVPFHGAWPYFARDYDLDVVAVIEPFPGREPTPQQLVETITLLNQVNAGAIFSEIQLNNQPAIVLADEANVPLGILDPIGGVEGREGYLDLMRYNARMIADTFARAAE